MDTSENVFIGIELVHWQTSLSCMAGVRAIISATITPPPKLPVIELRLAGIEYGAALGDGRVPVAGMKQRFALGGPHKNIWNLSGAITLRRISMNPVAL